MKHSKQNLRTYFLLFHHANCLLGEIMIVKYQVNEHAHLNPMYNPKSWKSISQWMEENNLRLLILVPNGGLL